MSPRDLYLGRFRIFHKGYLEVVKYILNRGNLKLIIAIGAAEQSHTLDIPFSGQERADMIYAAIAEEKLSHQVDIIQIDETQATFENWTKLVEKLSPPFCEVYSHSELVRDLFQKSGYPTSPVPQFSHQYSFDLVLKRMVNSEPWEALLPSGAVEVIKKNHLDFRVKRLYEQVKRGYF